MGLLQRKSVFIYKRIESPVNLISDVFRIMSPDKCPWNLFGLYIIQDLFWDGMVFITTHLMYSNHNIIREAIYRAT